MAYIGREPVTGSFEKQDLTADGSTTTFTLNYTVGSSSAILVSVSGVLQEPEVASLAQEALMLPLASIFEHRFLQQF